MISVLYVVSTLKRSGPNNVLYNLINELDRKVFIPKILTLSQEEASFPSLWEDFSLLEVEITSLNLSRLNGFLSGRSSLKKFVHSNKVDIIHLYGFRGDLLVRKIDFKNVKIVSTINSNIYDDYTMLYGKLKGAVMAGLHIKSLTGKIAIGCSSSIAKQLFNRYKIDLGVIRNGIPKKMYEMLDQEDKRSCKQGLNLPIDKNIFVFVGSLINRKDPLTVIEGFNASKINDSSYLLMIGDGPLMSLCKTLAGNASNIKFLGNQPETLKFLRAADFYVSASQSEGLPTSVMEAMGCGLPIILSDIDPHKELVDGIGNWEYIFPMKDSIALAEKMSEILEEDYQGLALQCRNVIEDEINSLTMAKEYQNIYTNKKI